MKETTTLEVYRDYSKEGDWHDQYVLNPETKVSHSQIDSNNQEVVYFCYVEPREDVMDKEYIFHRGGKDGPVIARGVPCPGKKNRTDLHLVDPKVTIPIDHKHHTHFCADGKWFSWHRQDQKTKQQEQEQEADYYPSFFTGHDYEFQLSQIKPTMQQIQDIVVITAVIVQMKEEETMGPVCTVIALANLAHVGSRARLGIERRKCGT